MHILTVQVRVKPEGVEAFKAACRANAEATLRESGCARYDVAQDAEDPCQFLLFEAYYTKQDHLAHRVMPHCEAWREAVAPLMAGPRACRTFVSVYPEADGWSSKKR